MKLGVDYVFVGFLPLKRRRKEGENFRLKMREERKLNSKRGGLNFLNKKVIGNIEIS